MWNIVSSNRLIDKKLKHEAHRKHVLALHTMKSSLNNNSPSQYSFLYSRPKAQQLRLGMHSLKQNARSISKTTTPSSSTA